jgi:hypothetical protein
LKRRRARRLMMIEDGDGKTLLHKRTRKDRTFIFLVLSKDKDTVA